MDTTNNSGLIEWIDKNEGLVEKAIDLCEECKEDYVPIFDVIKLRNRLRNELDKCLTGKLSKTSIKEIKNILSYNFQINEIVKKLKEKIKEQPIFKDLEDKCLEIINVADKEYCNKFIKFNSKFDESFDALLNKCKSQQIDIDKIKKSGKGNITKMRSLIIKILKAKGKWENEIEKSPEWINFDKLYSIKRLLNVLNSNRRIDVEFKDKNKKNVHWFIGQSIQGEQNDYSTILDQNFIQLMFLRQLIISDPVKCKELSDIMKFKINTENGSKVFSKLFTDDTIAYHLHDLGLDDSNIKNMLSYMGHQSFMNIRRSIVEVVAVLMLMRYNGRKVNQCYWKNGLEIIPKLSVLNIYQKLFDSEINDNYLKTVVIMTITSCVIFSNDSNGSNTSFRPLKHISWIPHALIRSEENEREIIRGGICLIYAYLLSLMLEDKLKLQIEDEYKWIIDLIKDCYNKSDFITFTRYVGIIIYSSIKFYSGEQAIVRNIDNFYMCLKDSLIYGAIYFDNNWSDILTNDMLYTNFINTFHSMFGDDIKFGKLQTKCLTISCHTFKANDCHISICDGEITDENIEKIGSHALTLMNTGLDLSLRENELIEQLPLGEEYYPPILLLSIRAYMRLYKEYVENVEIVKCMENVENKNYDDSKKELFKKIVKYMKNVENKNYGDSEKKLFKENVENYNKIIESYYESSGDKEKKISKKLIKIFMNLNRYIMFYMFKHENLNTLWLLIDINAPYLISGTIMDIFCTRPTSTLCDNLDYERILRTLQIRGFYKMSFLDHEMKPIDYSIYNYLNAYLTKSSSHKILGSGTDGNRYLKLVLSWILIILLIIIIVSLIVMLIKEFNGESEELINVFPI